MYVFKALAVLCCILYTNASTETTSTTSKPTEVCTICKQMVAEARQTLASNETMDEMKQVFEGTCRILVPIKSLAALCSKYADELVPELVETLYEEMDPTRVCVTSGLCAAVSLDHLMTAYNKINTRLMTKVAEVLQKTDPETLTKLAEHFYLPDSRIRNLLKGMCFVLSDKDSRGECADAVELYYPAAKTFLLTQYKNTGGECEFCKLIVSYIEGQALKPAFEQEVISVLVKICPYTGSYQGECNAFVQHYFPQLWALLVKEIKEKSICSDIGFCSAAPRPDLTIAGLQTDECQICKEVVTVSKSELLSDEAIAEARAAAISLCDLCPTKDSCVNYLNKNFDGIYKAIVSKLDADIVCKYLGVCPGDGKDPRVITVADMERDIVLPTLDEVQLIKPVSGDFECTICKYVVHYLQGEIVKNESVQYIKKTLKSMCHKLPSAYSNQCMGFVETYADAIAQLLAHEVDPNNVCYKITDACSQSRNSQNLPIKSLRVTKCSVCKMAVDYMDVLIQQKSINPSSVKLNNLVSQVCQMMPKSAAKLCMDIVTTHGPRMMLSIGQLSDSKEVCEQVSLCRRRLLGEKKCTYGPSYWCQDKAHAMECNALEHCMKHYWGKQI